MATTATAASPSVGGGGGNVLSDKVSRALHVRTDTPAMRAALDALARLPDADGSTPASGAAGGGRGGGGGGASAPTIDAKSVRAAIEGDALRRALAFQSELRRLAADASELRRRVGDVAGVCDLVAGRVEGQIVEAEGGAASSPADAHEAERSLASRLHSAQRSYVTSLRRQRAVESFLDRFDLDGNESRLLDHYNFETFLSEGFCAGAAGDGDASDPWTRQGASLCALTEPRDGDDADAFLDALERLTVIRAELGRTFGADGAGGDGDGPEDGAGGRLGAHSALRMMEQLASRQERAEERLHAFVQNYLGVGDAAAAAGARPTSAPTSSADALSGRRHPFPAEAPSAGLGRFRDGDEMDEAYGHPVLRRSLRVLRHSPARRDHALELLASGRRAEVTRRFLLALTSGYAGSPPLERMAHDPVAYVGDMLAFAFRSFRVEGELVRTLLSPAPGDEDGKGDGEGAESDAVGDDEDGGGAPMSAAAMLGQSMSGLARPLRTRVMQVVSSLATRGGGPSDPAAAMRLGGGPGDDGDRDDDDGGDSSLDRLAAIFSICGLLRFYGSAVTKALDKLGGGSDGEEENPLRSTCDACLSDAAEAYAASLRAYGAVLSSSSPSSPGGESGADLASRAIIRVAEGRSASPGFAEDLPGGGDGDDAASRLLSLPFLVGTMLDAASACPPSGPDDAAALRSALQVAARCGLGPDDVGRYASAVDGMGESSLEALASSEARSVLSSTGLGGVTSAYRDWSSSAAGGPMAGHPGLSRGELEAATRAFYSSLFSPPVPTFEGVISDPAMRRTARTRTARRVAGAYRELYGAATGERGGYGPDLSFLGHDPDQVDTLLSL